MATDITNAAAFADGWIARELEDWDGRTKDEIRESLSALRRDIGPHLLSKPREPECGEDHIVGSMPDDCFACLAEQRDELAGALRTILRGFDERVFVRCTDRDYRIDWAIQVLPFIHALGKAQEMLGQQCLAEDCPIHGGPNPEGL